MVPCWRFKNVTVDRGEMDREWDGLEVLKIVSWGGIL
jgi:hypothetical protein